MDTTRIACKLVGSYSVPQSPQQIYGTTTNHRYIDKKDSIKFYIKHKELIIFPQDIQHLSKEFDE